MKYTRYSKELLEPIVAECTTISDVLLKLGLVPRGGNFRTLKRNLIKFEIDFSHFTGQSWAKGLTQETSEAIKAVTEKNTKHTIETSLVDGVYLTSSTLRKLIVKLGREEVCIECGTKTIWNNKPITLHIDHINGVNTDNRPENLRFLCPNCHSQTETFGSKNYASSRNEFWCQPIVT